MRTDLRDLGAESRLTFTGTFERTGIKRGYKGPLETVLLLNVKDEEGNEVADHLWFNLTAGFARLGLKQGDVVQFNGRVEAYEKGYFGRREDVYAPWSIDYKISRPTRIIKIYEA